MVCETSHDGICFFFLFSLSCNSCSHIGDSGVWGLKKNFALLELLERLQNGPAGQCGVAEEAIGLSGEVLNLKEKSLLRLFKIISR